MAVALSCLVVLSSAAHPGAHKQADPALPWEAMPGCLRSLGGHPVQWAWLIWSTGDPEETKMTTLAHGRVLQGLL